MGMDIFSVYHMKQCHYLNDIPNYMRSSGFSGSQSAEAFFVIVVLYSFPQYDKIKKYFLAIVIKMAAKNV